MSPETWKPFLAWLQAQIGDIPYLLVSSTCETLYMTLTATAFATLLGVPLGVILYATRRGRFLANPYVYYPARHRGEYWPLHPLPHPRACG